MDPTCAVEQRPTKFEHAAAFYAGLEGLVETVVPFVSEGVTRGEPVLVALRPSALEAVEGRLGALATRVDFVDMSELGANPARIIPEWRRFLDDIDSGGPVRGVGEPVWPGRRAPEVEEAVLHEALLNLAFDGGRPWKMLCPYDTRLPSDVLTKVARAHPTVTGARVPAHHGADAARAEFEARLPPAPGWADEIPFSHHDLAGLRAVVRRLADDAGLARSDVDDLVLAAHELAANSVVHGGGEGVLRSWRTDGELVVELRDDGVIGDPLVGRDVLDASMEGGRGVAIAHELCDLVQLRSSQDGTVARIFTWL